MASEGIKLVFGTASFQPGASGTTYDDAIKQLTVLEEFGVKTIDTAYIYGDSEVWLGNADAASRFILDTKHPGGASQDHATKEEVLEKAQMSLERLKTDSVDTYYIHAPDKRVPLKETLAAIDKLHRDGKFKHFGLSQYTAADVEEVIRVAKENDYVMPTVFQSNYNAVARHHEKQVLPLLRKHGIRFYAYSPIAGGFLAKAPEQLTQGGEGRWDSENRRGKMYHALYNKPALLKALGEFGAIAKDAGIAPAELAYRWVAFNSALKADMGDAIIIGAKNAKQLRETLMGLRNGQLSDGIASRVDALWKDVEEESPLDNWAGYVAQFF